MAVIAYFRSSAKRRFAAAIGKFAVLSVETCDDTGRPVDKESTDPAVRAAIEEAEDEAVVAWLQDRKASTSEVDPVRRAVPQCSAVVVQGSPSSPGSPLSHGELLPACIPGNPEVLQTEAACGDPLSVLLGLC